MSGRAPGVGLPPMSEKRGVAIMVKLEVGGAGNTPTHDTVGVSYRASSFYRLWLRLRRFRATSVQVHSWAPNLQAPTSCRTVLAESRPERPDPQASPRPWPLLALAWIYQSWHRVRSTSSVQYRVSARSQRPRLFVQPYSPSCSQRLRTRSPLPNTGLCESRSSRTGDAPREFPSWRSPVSDRASLRGV